MIGIIIEENVYNYGRPLRSKCIMTKDSTKSCRTEEDRERSVFFFDLLMLIEKQIYQSTAFNRGRPIMIWGDQFFFCFFVFFSGPKGVPEFLTDRK